MVKRYGIRGVYGLPSSTTTGTGPMVGFSLDEDKKGKLVLYTDHASKMRGVLEALARLLYDNDTFIAADTLDKNRHYLEKGE